MLVWFNFTHPLRHGRGVSRVTAVACEHLGNNCTAISRDFINNAFRRLRASKQLVSEVLMAPQMVDNRIAHTPKRVERLLHRGITMQLDHFRRLVTCHSSKGVGNGVSLHPQRSARGTRLLNPIEGHAQRYAAGL